ncbi:hypothetical protein ACFZAV_02825 [Streptomyces sp. NPDC008343]|uniref:hypothetical protein n=1 Tax=Streptomyces sp. NPDC008343 TaxID=3364828 RepID=UPI0036E92A90
MGVTAEGPQARGAAARSTEASEAPADTEAVSRLFGPRGRHRRPRPRKVLLAAGGLALAAGALSLVRLTPDSGVTGLGAAKADPTPVPGTDTDGATNAAATIPTTSPKPSPSATSAMGGLGTTPTTGTIVLPTTNSPATTPPNGRGRPADDAAAPAPAPDPPATTGQAQQPASAPTETPAPSQTASNPPAPRPDDSDDGSVCIPIIGLCVDHLAGGG